MRKKGQVWSFDFIIGFILFIVILFVGIKMVINLVPSEDYDNLYRQTSQLSSSLVSSGHPVDWNASSVIIPGIADNNRINSTKLNRFDNLNYGKGKVLLHTTNEYIFYFKNKTSIINYSKCVRGYNISTNNNCEPDFTNVSVSNLVKFERLVILNSTLVSMVVYSWN